MATKAKVEHVDIIVNVLGNELNLKDGTLSKSIAIKAGQDVFTELRKQILVDKKDFIVTEGGRLLCKKIIHGILRHWDKPDESKRTLQYFMQNCLTLAESMNMRSIAFPAVGTGLPKFPPDVVASEMFSQAQSFSSSSLMTIEFVIFHDNMDVIRPFEAEMKKYLKDQTVRNKLSLHSSKPDNLFNMKSLLQSRESRSHINIRGEQNDQLENDLQYVSPDRRSDSSLPQFKYEATAPLMTSVDHHPCKNASAGRQHKTHGLYPSLLELQDPSEEHVEMEIKKYGEIVRQLKNIQKLVPCKADTSVEIRINKKGKIEVSGPKKFVSKTKRSIKSYWKRAEKADEFSQYVEWGYWNHNGHVDLFEKLLGYDLEIKYKENIKSTQFDHDGTLLLVDYGSMIMRYAGDFETKYKIVRIPKDSEYFGSSIKHGNELILE
ncbi:Hypothetical predicted protein [Mytilus galloprovincialis]|uniref:Macro domain-containing protein n=1 Tax=Mytilus galloprovincialis TaxID=29158 RepID=A0A8B6DWB4_MYTGA|nr:Hypothetical predicted protein [Mytilus galloprovincialis]